MMPQVAYEEITDEGLTVATKDGVRSVLRADSIITAFSLRPGSDLLTKLEGRVPEIYQIGDCREPGYMYDAIADGCRIGRMI